MPWYEIVSENTLETYKRNRKIVKIGTGRYNEQGRPKGFAICTATRLSKDRLTDLAVLYFSDVAAKHCADLLDEWKAQVCVDDPTTKDSDLLCIGDFAGLNDLLK